MLLDESRQEVMRWNFRRGWPCEWTGPELNAKDNEIAIEGQSRSAMKDLRWPLEAREGLSDELPSITLVGEIAGSEPPLKQPLYGPAPVDARIGPLAL